MRIISIVIMSVLALGMAASMSLAKVKQDERKPILASDTYSLRDYFGSGKLDFLTAPKVFKEMGLNGITYNDIWMKSFDKEYLDQIKKACADAGIKITGLICEGNLATTDEKAWEEQIKTNEMKMRAAAYLGAPIVRLNLGGLGDYEKDSTIGVKRCIDAFNRLIPVAKELNVKMTIENHGGVSKTADMILRIIKGTDPEWVGSCLDMGNWPDDVRYTECEKLAPYAYHTHAKTNAFTPQGEDTNKDYKRLMGIMKKNNYKYAISIEYEGTEDQMFGVKKTIALILRYWPELAK